MSSSIVIHWRKLSDSVHPDDIETFEGRPHSFNLDYPPPAFIGDVENAPVILLEANGGFDPIVTPSEFAQPGSRERYLDMLHRPRPVDPGEVAPYYGRRNYAVLIKDGHLALVNAVAYRSRRLSGEPAKCHTC